MCFCEYVECTLSEVNGILYIHILMLRFGVENIPCTEKIITFFEKVIRYSHFHLLCFLLIYFEMPCFFQIEGDSTINLDAIFNSF